MKGLMLRPPALVLAFVLAIAFVSLAHADGEAGLVIQHGDGTTETFCIAFEGDGISGDELLRRANQPVVQFSGLVCAIGTQEGCFQPSSFESCACQCKGNDCTYWAFFTQRYGAGWRYSAIGYQGQEAKDGDLQGWRWGKGSPTSAPVPAPLSFEQVCGHAPRGGAAVATATLPPATATSPAATASPTQPLSPLPKETFTAVPPSPSLTNTPLVTIRTPDATPGVPAAGTITEEDGPGASGLLAFAAVALVLAGAVTGAVLWRQHHGL